MNKLLPNLEELEPITENSKTFYDSGFNQKFEILSFEKQLQIINDIIRQSMIYTKYPNPDNDQNTLIGDDYTSALVSITYLKYLNIGINHRIAFARRRPFEIDNKVSKKVVVLVDDLEHNTYFFDATPIVDYKCGHVSKDVNKLYQEYIVLDNKLKHIYEIIRMLKYKYYTKTITNNDIKNNLDIIYESVKYDFLITDIKEIISSENIEPSIIINNVQDNKINYSEKEQKNLIIKYLQTLKEELNDLISSDINYQRQIELSQLITKFTNFLEEKPEMMCHIDNQNYLMSQLTPRLFLEKGWNLVMIKPSAYIFNWEDEVKSPFLYPDYKTLGEYQGGLGYDSNLGLKIMRLFHPHGYMYERSMAGPTDIFLVKRNASEIGNIKRNIRQEYKKKVNSKEVLWFDNQFIEWNPICLNFAHSSDDPCEACMGYTVMYPEYQLMTRFMYPNPILIKEEKKYGRIRI